MEVTLNQNLHQFFLLAPHELVNSLVTSVFRDTSESAFTLHGRDIDTRLRLGNSVQPDLLFTTDHQVLSVEMKLGAKCSPAQVLKYALLGLAVELSSGNPMRHDLLLIGQGSFRDQWREHFQSTTELRGFLSSTDVSAFMSKQPAHFHAHVNRFAEIVGQMQFGFLNYEELINLLEKASPGAADGSQGARVYRSLLQGVIEELRLRRLTRASGHSDSSQA